MDRIQEALTNLVAYALKTGLIQRPDIIWAANSLLGILKIDDWQGNEAIVEKAAEAMSEEEIEAGRLPDQYLSVLVDYAVDQKLTGGESTVYRDLFDTLLMGQLTPRPSEVIRSFQDAYARSPEAATQWFYHFSQDTNYIRRGRIKKDRKWKTETPYGPLDITINLSKPEKDPRAIAAARNAAQSSYPKCQLCMENEGYYGRVNHPARENHRIIPIGIANYSFGFQYSPYVYYNEHCIVFNHDHVPMKIDHEAFVKLFGFIRLFPHYIIGSNADLPIVGGSILSHDHFQGGHYQFPMASAPLEKEYKLPEYPDVRIGRVRWPMSVLRLTGEDPEAVIRLADHILDSWRSYSDPEAFIYAETDGEKHNTITPIARRVGELFELDLVLRNNITTAEHPLGVFHPHAELHHIKKENIGLIEVMGLAVLPSRLEREMKELRSAILNGTDLTNDPALASHAAWVGEFRPKYEKLDEGNIDAILEKEIGLVFMRVLEDAGVYKRTEEGQKAFDRFVGKL